MCDCYKIGGPFIAEDPDCPVHGVLAVAEQEEIENKIRQLEREVQAWRERFPKYVYRPQDDCVALKL